MPTARPSPAARYRIGMVARLAGLTTHSIRMWERRYGAVSPVRSAGGGRLYSDEDVARLRALHDLVEDGHAIGQIAALSDDALAALRQGSDPSPDGSGLPARDLEDACGRFLEALTRADMPEAERVVQDVAARVAVRRLIQEFVLPIQQEIGRRWSVGELRIVQEHAATQIFRTLLGSTAPTNATAPDAPVALSCAPTGQHHELGAMMAGMIAAEHGYRVIHLGGDVPVEEIVHGVGSMNAELILLSITVDDVASVEQLETLARELPDEVRLIVGGRGAPRGRSGTELITDFETLDEDLREALPR